jgi:hypothetical protein
VQYNETMGSWAAALVAAALATGCNYGAGTFRCMADNQCGAAGTCEPEGLCSRPNGSCPSGRAYSDLSGAQSGQCVGGGIVTPDSGTIDAASPPDVAVDASIDARPPLDATACFGSGLVTVCLATPPTQPLTISARTVIDTDDTSGASQCAVLITGSDVCVVAATVITINADLHATGTRPLVVLATDSLTVAATGSIDVGSHRAPASGLPEIGAGANPSSCGTGTGPGTSGGGAGGSFTGQGGAGGGPNLGIPAAIVGTVTELRGGCAGQDGNGANHGAKGNGGGAVFLIAGNTITIAGTVNAAGEGGAQGANNSSGGGGGGSGGMIGFDALTISGTGLILANGGAGGEGSGAGQSGRPGADPTTIMAARGGNGGSNNGGDGGDGSAGAASGPGGAGVNGSTAGGGGGGGAGLIKAPAQATLGTQVSPLAIP